MGLRRWVRVLVVGRRDGVRARVRRRIGVCSRLDQAERASSAPPGAVREESPQPAVSGPRAPEGWVRILDRAEISSGEVIEVFVEDRAIVVVDVGGQLSAIDSVCPHAGGPLADGQLEGSLLTCPWHGWTFDVCTGSCGVSDDIQLQTFEIRVEGGEIFVELPSAS